MTAIDTGALSGEQVLALQRRIQRRGRCFNCGKPGHIAKNCRMPKRHPGQGGKGAGRGAGPNPAGGRACHNCKKVGHFARECPEPKTEEQKRYHLQQQQGRRPNGGGGGFKPRNQQLNSTQGVEQPVLQFLMEEIQVPTTTTTTRATTTMTTTSGPPSVSPLRSRVYLLTLLHRRPAPADRPCRR